jgi:hypothetical protein
LTNFQEQRSEKSDIFIAASFTTAICECDPFIIMLLSHHHFRITKVGSAQAAFVVVLLYHLRLRRISVDVTKE